MLTLGSDSTCPGFQTPPPSYQRVPNSTPFLSSFLLLDFFEECIKEEQYEADKLDILRDAVRAKATYTTQSKSVSVLQEQDDGGLDSSLSSQRSMSSPTPPPLTPIHENGAPNGTATNGTL